VSPDKRRPKPRVVTPLDPRLIDGPDSLEFPLTEIRLKRLVKAALDEDKAFSDVTTAATILSNRRGRATLVARQRGVVAGVPIAVAAFRMLDPLVTIRIDAEDGGEVQPNVSVFYLSGHARGMLSAERVALNFMQRLSGVATVTRTFVDAVKGTSTRILDTRKTTPGWRALEKYAVRAGGGFNHRMDLASAVLIKDNHLAAVDGNIGLAVRRARKVAPPGASVEVECDSVEQVEAALDAGADIILLDNMSISMLAQCVRRTDKRAILEASGGVNLKTVRAIAETGVDWISIGALTHSAPALDLALDFTSA
jgi:nicotinate-nucleotide pyrophosphorylase (carboxylating)